MKRIIFSFVYVCVALCILAETTMFDRSQQRLNAIVKEQPVKTSNALAEDKSLSLQRVLKERHLTLDDNRLSRNVPDIKSSPCQFGDKIAWVETYDFSWDETNAVATVIDTTGATMGKHCSISSDPEEDKTYLSGFYGDFKIPVSMNDGFLTITARAPLAYLRFYDNGDPYSINKTDNDNKYFVWTLHAMPLSWLEGDSAYHDIRGSVHCDGSIEFCDDFVFIVKEQYFCNEELLSTSWGISLIFKNLVLYQPNAIHSFKTSKMQLFDVSDVVPKDPKPHGHGGGGHQNVPIRPRPNTGHTKTTTTPRGFDATIGNMPLMQDNTKSHVECNTINALIIPSRRQTERIYMFQLDDTTLMVYNLFGKDYCWNVINFYSDNSVYVPNQPIAASSEGKELYNCSKDKGDGSVYVWGNLGSCSQNRITWDTTYLCCDSETEGLYRIEETYYQNKIVLNCDLVDLMNEYCPSPCALAVVPEETSAHISWNDNVNVGWRLRYRPSTDDSGCQFTSNLNGDYCDALSCFYNDWSIDDSDGDGFGWHITEVSDGDYSFQCDSWWSQSYDQENWLISKKVMLHGALGFTMWGTNANYTYELVPYVCTGEYSSITDFEPLPEALCINDDRYLIDLSAYSYQQGYIAFRHYNRDSRKAVYLDSIFIGDPSAQVVEPAEWVYIDGIDVTNYTIEGLMPRTTYEVQVQAFSEDGRNSIWTKVLFPTKTTHLLGDVNNDNKISIADVTALINALLADQYDDTVNFNVGNADCDQSGDIKIGDVTALINLLLGGSLEE